MFHLCAMFNLLIGLTLVSQFNVWSMTLSVFVTLLGWWMIIRGVMALFVPQVLMKLCMGKGNSMKICGVVELVWGLLLCWYAFWM